MSSFNLSKKFLNSEKNLVDGKSYLKYNSDYNLKKSQGRVNVCVVYPNIYEMGMCNLGYLIVCDILDSYNGVHVDRAFYNKNINECRGFLTGRKLKDFDLILFSVPYEIDILNIEKILSDGGIDLNKSHPYIVAGGTAIMINPNIAKHFADLVALGDAEILLTKFCDVFTKNNLEENFIFETLKNEAGFYFPKYQNTFGNIVKVKELENIFFSPVISKNFVFKETVLIDAGRGCPYTCKFCVTGNYFKPLVLIDAVKFIPIIEYCKNLGVNSFGIVSSCVAKLQNLKELLLKYDNVKINVSSLRFEDIDEETVSLFVKTKQKVFTLAPETGTEKLRDSVSKHISNSLIVEKVRLIHKHGGTVKLYFMFGLPNENLDDVYAIAELVKILRETGQVKACIQAFVPKPHTPFENFEFENVNSLKNKKIQFIKKIRELKIPSDVFEFGSIKESFMEYKICRCSSIKELNY